VARSLFDEFAREFTAEINRQRSALVREKETLQGELVRLNRQIDKLVEAIIDGADALAVNTKLKALEGPRNALGVPRGAHPGSDGCKVADTPSDIGPTQNSAVFQRLQGDVGDSKRQRHLFVQGGIPQLPPIIFHYQNRTVGRRCAVNCTETYAKHGFVQSSAPKLNRCKAPCR
jgi:hypothetical protein